MKAIRTEPTSVETPPLKVLVSELSGAPLSPDDLRTLQMPQPVDLPRQWQHYWPLYAAVGAGAALVTTLLLLSRRKRRGVPLVVVPAHEWARRMFAQLVADDLLAKDRVQEFFYRVSGILRGYIERRFGVSAPEMTTEEFLAAASSDIRFPTEHAETLKPFLLACDLVKFAQHQPRPDDAGSTLRAALDFVETTRPRDDEAMESSSDSRDSEVRR